MNDNPYQSPASTNKTRSTRWLVMLGGVCLVLGTLCGLTGMGVMYVSFHAIANATSAPKPQELANGIGWASLWLLAALPLCVLGFVALVAGLLIRKPVE